MRPPCCDTNCTTTRSAPTPDVCGVYSGAGPSNDCDNDEAALVHEQVPCAACAVAYAVQRRL